MKYDHFMTLKISMHSYFIRYALQAGKASRLIKNPCTIHRDALRRTGLLLPITAIFVERLLHDHYSNLKPNSSSGGCRTSSHKTRKTSDIAIVRGTYMVFPKSQKGLFGGKSGEKSGKGCF